MMADVKAVYTHKVVDKGLDVHVLFYVDGSQVGASVFLDHEDYDNYFLALELGRVWDGLSK